MTSIMCDQELKSLSFGVCVYHSLILYSNILFCVITCRHTREGCSTYVYLGLLVTILTIVNEEYHISCSPIARQSLHLASPTKSIRYPSERNMNRSALFIIARCAFEWLHTIDDDFSYLTNPGISRSRLEISSGL